MSVEDILHIALAAIGAIGGGFGSYVAIRADLAAMKATVELLSKAVDRVHVRIDEMR